MAIELPSDGNDTATWVLTNSPTGTPQVELEGTWHNVAIANNGTVISIPIAGPTDLTPPTGAVIITKTQRPRVRVAGVIRQGGSIYLRTT
jgi:hypothetical protein